MKGKRRLKGVNITTQGIANINLNVDFDTNKKFANIRSVKEEMNVKKDILKHASGQKRMENVK